MNLRFHNPETDPAGPQLLRVDALGAVDAAGFACAPVSVLLDRSVCPVHVLAIGTPGVVDAHPAAAAPGLARVRRDRSILIPGLVNAHTHLDLTLIGPQPHDPERGFVHWIEMVRQNRPTDDESIQRAVERGVALSRSGGVVAVGDISGATAGRPNAAAWHALAGSGMLGTSFLEFFAIGTGEPRVRAFLDDLIPTLAMEAASAALREGGPDVLLSVQPHAPNTVAPSMYAESVRYARTLAQGQPRGPWRPESGGAAVLATHLAETAEERAFVAEGRGPQRELLERLGLWTDDLLGCVGLGRHPVAHVARALDGCGPMRLLAAHVNDAPDEAIAVLAQTGTVVAYCPRASAYFDAQGAFGPHRYRDMLAAGVPVAIGTDSIINLPRGENRISVLDEMRFLHRRDGTDPMTLLAMGTVHGARGLGLNERFLTFGSGRLAGLVAIECDSRLTSSMARGLVEAVMSSAAPAELLFGGKKYDLAGIDRMGQTNRA